VTVVAVLGNHDYESEKADEVKKILADAGITVLDGDFRRDPRGGLRRRQGLRGRLRRARAAVVG